MKPTPNLWAVSACAFFFACGSGASLTGDGAKSGDDDGEASTKIETTSQSTPSTEAPVETEDKIELERRVIPPEAIAGSYLTCSFVETDDTQYGCTAFDSEGTRLNLRNVKADWSLVSDGEPVSGQQIEIPDGSIYHHLWQLEGDYSNANLQPGLTVYDEDGNPQSVKVRGVVVVNP